MPIFGNVHVGVLKLPVSHKESAGKFLVFLGFLGLVAVGAYVWRNWGFDD